MEKEELQAQGLFDIFKFLSQENLEKINELLKMIKIEKTDEGTKISIIVKS